MRDLILPTLPPWHRNAPHEVLAGADFDACRAVSTARKLNAQLAKDKIKGMRQDEDFARAPLPPTPQSGLSMRLLQHTNLVEIPSRRSSSSGGNCLLRARRQLG